MTVDSSAPHENGHFVGDVHSRATPTPMSSDEFLDLVRRSNLIDENNLNALLRTLRKRTGGTETAAPQLVAELLVQAKLLTDWQAAQLLNGQFEDFFLGRYKLLSMLGRGAMGVIYLAEHVRMRRRAALKILPRKFVEDPRRLELFYRESEATAALDHPNVVRAYDVDNEGEIYYLVMEYVDGANLDEIVSRRGPMPFMAAANYIRQAADGLAHAHDCGIIHRDIKPANLMLDTMDRIKILDMGLSHWKEVEASPTVARGEISGTPSYIAPELASGSGDVDTSSDIYSLRCTFHYLLTGGPPFTADSITDILQKHLEQPAPRLTESVPELPDGLEQIYLRMMEKRPADRFVNAKEVFEKLTDWQRSLDQPAVAFTSDRGDQDSSAQSYRILVAEDDPVTQQMLSLQLEKAGFEVRAAGDGREAMGMIDSDITVCLFDLNMPHANGIECLQFVQSRFPNTPVIILTASSEIQDAIVAMREGAFDYLTKPCRINNVLARLEKAIQARARSAEDGESLNALINSVGTESSLDTDTIVIQQKEVDHISFNSAPTTATPRSESASKTPRILLVEDNEMIREMLSRRLKKRKFEVLVAVDGRDGITKAQNEDPDLILMDIGLPEINGCEATRMLKQDAQTSDIPLIILTAHATTDEREQALQAGCDAFATKPIDFPRLIESIRALLS